MSGVNKIRLRAARTKIGMRTIKTITAVFICCIIDYFRGVVPLQSTMAAIFCIQPDTENTIKEAVSRILATLLGSITATVFLLVLSVTNIAVPSIPFYLLTSILLIPIITLTVRIKKSSATALTCIIFLSIALGDNSGGGIFMASLWRMVDTLVGIFVALPINALLPNRSRVRDKVAEEDTEEKQI